MELVKKQKQKYTYCSVCKYCVLRFDIHQKSNKHKNNKAKQTEYIQSREILLNVKMI
jgi:hypothetical protein